MKKVLACIIAVCMLSATMSFVPAFADVVFPDLPQDHWAAESVNKLIATGTVNGFEDGTFRPAGIVSRAEFVKMLGKSETKTNQVFADVPETHWAYDYIMYSGLDGDSLGNFRPADGITRGEVASLLYKRFANGAKSLAPYFISAQSQEENVASWVYNTGLMVGADMVDLRLEDTLTRSEAAVLIVRARELDAQKMRAFIDNFSDDVYKTVYDGLNIFDTEYAPNDNITYEELAAAVIRYQYKEYTPIVRYITTPQYEGEYAKYWDVMCKYALSGKEYSSTKENAQKLVTKEDAIAMLAFAAQGNYYFDTADYKPSGKTYAEIKPLKKNSYFAEAIGFSYDKGISLYENGKLKTESPITKREIACILMQYNMLYGAEVSFNCTAEGGDYIPARLRLNKSTYPQNHSGYIRILDEVPNYVYEAPFGTGKTIEKSPVDFADHFTRFSLIYVTPFCYIAQVAQENGAEVDFTIYSSLAARVLYEGPLYRVKLNVGKLSKETKLSDIIKLSDGVEDKVIKEGDCIYIDVAANQSVVATTMDYTLYSIDKIIG